MNKLIKFAALLTAALLVLNPAMAKTKAISPNISHAPAIEASYDQVRSDLNKHLGVNVRWGGQIIESQKLDKLTRVTLFAYPLDAQGKPSAQQAVSGNVFVVDFDKSTSRKNLSVGSFITVYGTVDGGLKITNGPLETLVPVLVSQEVKKWKSRQIAGFDRRRNSVTSQRARYYNSLGFSDRRFGFSNSRFGFNNSRFAFRGSRFGKSRFGFGSSRFGFRGSRFGFGSSKFGFGRSKFGFGSRGFSRFNRFGR